MEVEEFSSDLLFFIFYIVRATPAIMGLPKLFHQYTMPFPTPVSRKCLQSCSYQWTSLCNNVIFKATWLSPETFNVICDDINSTMINKFYR